MTARSRLAKGSMKRTRLLVVSASNFLRAYAGVQYLSNALADHGLDVEVYAPIPRHMLHETAHCRFRVHSHYDGVVGRIPRLRVFAFVLSLVARALAQDCALLFTELRFLKQAAFIKRLRPRIPCIHYCQEYLTPEEFPEYRGVRDYEALANIPDLIIDVEPARAASRRERFRIHREIVVLPNTLPLSELPSPAPCGSLARLAGRCLPSDRPILVYAGGIHPGTGMQTVVSALSELRGRVFFLAFCNVDEPHRMESFRQMVGGALGVENASVCDGVPRSLLLSCLHEATAGLVYYPYQELPTFNQHYCAPTKVYEYFAAGLPVIASSNPPLVDLVEKRGLGVCAVDGTASGLRAAIAGLLLGHADLTAVSARARGVFRNELCYERQSRQVVSRILEVVSAPGRMGSNA